VAGCIQATRSDGVPTPTDGNGGSPPDLRALDGPPEDELEYAGPGEGGDGIDAAAPDTALLPGGVDHTTAAVGGGTVGMVLLGIAGVFKRRWARRRYAELDE
jgi:hypothetical protein